MYVYVCARACVSVCARVYVAPISTTIDTDTVVFPDGPSLTRPVSGPCFLGPSVHTDTAQIHHLRPPLDRQMASLADRWLPGAELHASPANGLPN